MRTTVRYVTIYYEAEMAYFKDLHIAAVDRTLLAKVKLATK